MTYLTDKEIQEHIEKNCRNAHGEPMMDEQAFYEGAKWHRDTVVKNNAVLQHVSNSSDLEDDCVYCKYCGEEMEWQECWSCGGEGGRGWEDLQFEDPLWYSPDDFIGCDECDGGGGMWICQNKNCG